VASRAMLFGFSRGAQLAHRFALYFPTRVRAVAALSAGTYTLPDSALSIGGREVTLPLPYGLADLDRWVGHPCNDRALTRVPFWIAVGSTDNRDGDVPRAWDPYIGTNRIARARSFVDALHHHRVRAGLTIFPGVDHALTPAIEDSVYTFLD